MENFKINKHSNINIYHFLNCLFNYDQEHDRWSIPRSMIII